MKRALWLSGLVLGLTLSGTVASAQPIVSLTFDDGLLSATTAQALLDSHGMKGTFYIISGLIGSDPTFYLGLPAIKAIATDGHEIGGHTVTHPDLTTLTTAQQQVEICNGRTQLIADGFSPISFAYPYGNATAATTAIVKGCGFTSGRGAWCNFPQYSTPNDQGQGTCAESIPPGATGIIEGDTVDDNGDGPYWMNTEEAVSSGTTLGDLETYVTNAENPQLANEGLPVPNPSWVILQFHFICADTDPTCGEGGNVAEQYGISVSTFTAFLDWLQGQVGSGAVVVQTVGQVTGGLPVNPIPVIGSVSPSSTTVGMSASTLTLTGVNFISTSTVQWNGSPVTTTFVSSTTLNALIPAADLATVGVATMTVSNGVNATSPNFLYSVVNPVPVLTTLSSTFTIVGSTGITLTATGSNFVPKSVVRWNGSARTTTFISSTTLSAAILSTDLSTVKIDSVTVFNATPGGGTSSTQTFTVGNPLPVPASLSPSSAVVGGPAFSLTVTGSNFVSGAVVLWNGSARATSFTNSTTIVASILAGDLAQVGITTITVSNPAPGGGLSSSGKNFTVGNAVPVLTTLSSSATAVGSPAFSLTVTGSNFVSGASVLWNGSTRTTTFVNNTTLTALIPASDLTVVGTFAVTILNPAPGGGTSNALTFTVGNPGPGLAALSPNFAPVGSTSTLTMNVTGLNFVVGSVVQWNGSPLTTSTNSSTSLTALIPATDLTSLGIATITVSNPAPGGGLSNPLPFTIGFPAPGLTAIDPAFITAGGPSFTLTATGSFSNGSVLEWNGSPLTMISTSNTKLSATVPSSDVLVAGDASITVFTPAPGGGTSTAFQVTISTASGGGASVSVVAPRIYPNPWRADRPNNGYMKFDQMPANSTVKIFTISAHSVRTLDAADGSVTWDLKNDSGDNVASGYYIYLITGPGVKIHGTLAVIR